MGCFGSDRKVNGKVNIEFEIVTKLFKGHWSKIFYNHNSRHARYCYNLPTTHKNMLNNNE